MILELFKTVGKNVQRRVFDCANSAVRDDYITTTYYSHAACHAVLHEANYTVVMLSMWSLLV